MAHGLITDAWGDPVLPLFVGHVGGQLVTQVGRSWLASASWHCAVVGGAGEVMPAGAERHTLHLIGASVQRGPRGLLVTAVHGACGSRIEADSKAGSALLMFGDGTDWQDRRRRPIGDRTRQRPPMETSLPCHKARQAVKRGARDLSTRRMKRQELNMNAI